MRRWLLAFAAIAALAAGPARAQSSFPTPQGNNNAPGFVNMCPSANGVYLPCGTPGALPFPIAIQTSSPIPVAVAAYPPNTSPITGNATGTTGAVVGTLAASPGRTTFLCGFVISAVGGTATIGPITVAGLAGGSQTYFLTSTAAGVTLNQTFTPCIAGSAPNTAITLTTTADGTASNVTVNSWGFTQ
jgi:hypothetical protein